MAEYGIYSGTRKSLRHCTCGVRQARIGTVLLRVKSENSLEQLPEEVDNPIGIR